MSTTRSGRRRSKNESGEWRSGARALGVKVRDPSEMVRRNRDGFAYRCYAHFEKQTGLSREAVSELVGIPERTLSRRQSAGRLRPDESDRLLRAARLFGAAVALFEGDVNAARRWLLAPQPGLGGEVPLELATTEAGAREVEALLGRIEHGVFA